MIAAERRRGQAVIDEHNRVTDALHRQVTSIE